MYLTYHGHVAVGGFAGRLLALLLEPLLLLLVLLRGVLLLVKVVAVVVLSLNKYFLLYNKYFSLDSKYFSLFITFTVTPSAARWSPGYCSSGTAGEIVEASKLCRGTNIFTSSCKYFPV